MTKVKRVPIADGIFAIHSTVADEFIIYTHNNGEEHWVSLEVDAIRKLTEFVLSQGVHMNDDISDRLTSIEAKIARIERAVTDTTAKLKESDPDLSGWWVVAFLVGELMGLTNDINARNEAEQA